MASASLKRGADSVDHGHQLRGGQEMLKRGSAVTASVHQLMSLGTWDHFAILLLGAWLLITCDFLALT